MGALWVSWSKILPADWVVCFADGTRNFRGNQELNFLGARIFETRQATMPISLFHKGQRLAAESKPHIDVRHPDLVLDREVLSSR